MPSKAGEGGFTGDEGLCFCCPRDEMTELAEGGDFETLWDHFRYIFFLWDLKTLLSVEFKEENMNLRNFREFIWSDYFFLSWELGCNAAC